MTTRAHFPAIKSDRVIVVTASGERVEVFAATLARLLPAAAAVYDALFALPDADYAAVPVALRAAIVRLSAATRGEPTL